MLHFVAHLCDISNLEWESSFFHMWYSNWCHGVGFCSPPGAPGAMITLIMNYANKGYSVFHECLSKVRWFGL